MVRNVSHIYGINFAYQWFQLQEKITIKKKSTHFYTSFHNMKVNGGGIHILLYNLALYIE